ncbi:ATP synthase subunit I [Caviibacterium pharyngocola]|uniref:ATP F0F1 synthase subunit I n=1 Tax=Caviibacterium pharyngocola TaxID=28159 RepID=A0A2M8RUE7_9PAST|nr:ATP synthase subunit I [Caviibacterium pharyngocola]PJG82522.1 ATP F0F1 synthase subunit I [Caviibacterium pharyngocola]
MSLVFDNTKKLYKKVFVTEIFFIIILSLFVYFLFTEQFLPFLLGSLIAFLPQIVFIGYALIIKGNAPIENKAKVLYQSEGLKLALTVGLFILVFAGFKPDFAGLFSGYFIVILLNNLLPVFFNITSTRK